MNTFPIKLLQLKRFAKDGSQRFRFHCKLHTMDKGMNDLTKELAHYMNDPHQFCIKLTTVTAVAVVNESDPQEHTNLPSSGTNPHTSSTNPSPSDTNPSPSGTNPSPSDYIDSMVNKIDSICTTFDSIIRGGLHRLNLWKSSWFMLRSTRSSTVEKTDSIIHNGDTRIRMKIDSIIHTTRNRNLGMGLDLHMCSKDLPRGLCYFTGLMSFSFTSYCLLLSCFAVRLTCIGYQWLSLFSVCLRVSDHLAIPCVHLAWNVSFTVSF